MKIFLLHVLSGILVVSMSPIATQAEQLDHFIMNGQSLSTGHQSWPVLSTENVSGNFMLGNQIWMNYGNDLQSVLNPLVGTLSKDFANDGDNGTRSGGAIAECPLLGVVNHLQLKYGGNKILATSVGVSGAAVEELSKECETRNYYAQFESMVSRAKTAVSESDYKLNCPVIFWMQGEFNYSVKSEPCGLKKGEYNTTDKREYKSLMLKLKENMQADLVQAYGQSKPPVWITYQTGAQYVRENVGIGMAQLEAANENADVIMAGPVYPMTDRGGHLDANGYRWFGEMLAKVYYKTQVLGEEFLPLQPKKITREDGGKTIRVNFHVPSGPLAFDTQTLPKIKNYGFNVYHQGYGSAGRQDIKSITIDGNDVVMTFDNALTGKVFITYGDPLATIENQPSGKNSLQGHGNLRDSDPYEGVLKYIDLDAKDSDNEFVYYHKDGEPTLRPDYEPTNDQGNVIYGKTYPLYNFAVSFYYELRDNVNELVILDENNNPVADPNAPVEGSSDIVYVDAENGDDSNDGLSSQSALASLAKAIKSLKWSGATVIINGTVKLEDELNLEGFKDLTIKGINDATIDGQGQCRIAETNGMSIALEDLTIANCFSYMAGSVLSITRGDLTATNVIIRDNQTSTYFEADGAIYVNNGNITLTDCDFIGNTSYSGGALKLIQGTLIAKGCLFDGNKAVAASAESNQSDCRGGAIYVSNANSDFDDCTFINNYSKDSGGVFLVKYCHQSNLHFTLNSCDVIGNTSDEHSGVSMAWNTVDPNFEFNFVNCTIHGNTAKSCGGVAWFLEGLSVKQTLNIYNCTITGNHSKSGRWHCGGLRLFSPNLYLNIYNTILEGNTGGDSREYSDLHIKGYADAYRQYPNAQYSIIGKFITDDNCSLTQLAKATKSYINGSPANAAEGPANEAGLAGMVDGRYFPFASEEAASVHKGNDNGLKRKYGITTDRLGNTRSRNYMGSIESTVDQSGISDILTGSTSRDLKVSIDGNELVAYLPESDEKFLIDIYSISGRHLLDANASGVARIDISSLDKGIYAARATAGGRNMSTLFVKK